MKITVCIGSSCHLKGSRQIIEELRSLTLAHSLKDIIDLGGVFCMGNCQQGVCVTLDGQLYSLQPDTVKDFFEKEVLSKVQVKQF